MRPHTFFTKKYILTGLLVLLLVSIPAIVQAQSSQNWSSPARIPGLFDSNIEPVFLADSEGTLHLFHSQSIADVLAIFYIRWTLQQGWSNLVDIVNAPRGDARIYGVHLDQEGWLHMLFFGGDDLAADIFYTRAPASGAAKSTSWMDPVLIGPQAITPSDAVLLGDGQGFLLAAYSGDSKGNGIYVMQSQDGGENWSTPEALFLTYNDLLWPYGMQLVLGDGNLVYATWSLRNEAGLSEAVFFARYDRLRQQWSEPLLVASAIEFQADAPRLIEHQKRLILVYHNDFPTTRWLQTSSDNGDTWSRPVRLFEQVGSNGAVSYAVDSQGQLYMLFGNRVGTPAIHGVWESDWLGNRWGKPEAVVSGPQIRVGPNGEEGFDPSFVQTEVIQGNILFAQWRHDPQAGPTYLWFSYRLLNVPAEPTQLLPTVYLTPTSTSTATQVVTETPLPAGTVEPSGATPTLSNPSDSQTSGPLSDPNLSIILGIVPVSILILVALFVQARRRQ